jgi:TRAP-type C4-dicarboxylate transport system permease small subunit
MRCVLLGFLLLVAYLGLQATLRVQEQLTTAMEISISWGYAAVPVSFACMAFEMVRFLWRDLRGCPK